MHPFLSLLAAATLSLPPTALAVRGGFRAKSRGVTLGADTANWAPFQQHTNPRRNAKRKSVAKFGHRRYKRLTRLGYQLKAERQEAAHG